MTLALLSTVPATLKMPPLDTPTKAAVPPADRFNVPPEIPVPDPLAPEIDPPDKTFSTPPVYTPVLLSTLPATLKMPPLDTPTCTAEPPARTFTTPPAKMTVAALDAPEMNPPDSTFSTPPLETSVLLVIVPATFRVPLDTVRSWAVPPAETFRVPLETVR